MLDINIKKLLLYLMQSVIAKELKMKYNPVAILFTDDKPDEAMQFREHKWGCVMALYNVVMKLGKTSAFDRDTYGCIGGGVGLCFGNTFKGSEDFMRKLLADREGYFKSHALADDFMDNLPYADIPYKYVIFKPLDQIDAAKEKPVLVSFPVNADQIAPLAMLVNYRRKGNDHVTAPFGSGCQSVCVLPYNEINKEYPRAIIGNLDLTSRKILPPDILTFTVPLKTFLEMEEDAPLGLFESEAWLKIAQRLGGDE